MTAIALTIAGSDSGGGAGIQADLKTFSALGVFGTSALTAVTAQNTLGVSAIEDISPGMVRAQIEAVLSDFAVGAIKIGMVSRAETIEAVGQALQGVTVPVVVDPVMVATSGDRLLQSEAVAALREKLLPLAAVVTPNLHEAALLSDQPIAPDEAAMVAAGQTMLSFGPSAVLVKGGHGSGAESTDLLVTQEKVERYAMPRLIIDNDHGTGCTLAAAITAELAKGNALIAAVGTAKAYLHAAMDASRDMKVGRGRGPVQHFYKWWPGA